MHEEPRGPLRDGGPLSMTRQRPRRLALFACLMSVGLLVVFEGLAHVAIWALSTDARFDFTPVRDRQAEMQASVGTLLEAQGEALLQLDDELGWLYAPNYRGDLYSSNSEGLRGQREYPSAPSEGTLRIAAFGDSFIHANEVADEDGWSARLEALDPRVEALNYGVGGYGTDQALLYYQRRGLELDPDVVVLGFVEVDYARNVNRFRRFLSVHELPLFKPRFLIAHGDTRETALELVPNAFPGAESMRVLLEDADAVRQSAEHDWFYEDLVWSNPLYDHVGLVRLLSTLVSEAWRARLRPDGLYRDGQLNTDSEAFAVLVSVIERFAEIAEERGQQFVLVIFPARDADIWSDSPPAYQPLLDALDDRHIVLDLAGPLRDDPAVTPANLRRASRHYGPEANATLARAMQHLAIDQGWLPTGS